MCKYYRDVDRTLFQGPSYSEIQFNQQLMQ